MQNEILAQKIKFAREILIVLKVSLLVLCVVTVAGICFALYRGKPWAAVWGGLAGNVAIVFMLFHFLHIQSWLARNQPDIDDTPTVPLEQVRQQLWEETERERIQKQEADKSHWAGTRRRDT